MFSLLPTIQRTKSLPMQSSLITDEVYFSLTVYSKFYGLGKVEKLKIIQDKKRLTSENLTSIPVIPTSEEHCF